MPQENTDPRFLVRKLLSAELPWGHHTDAGYVEQPTRLEAIARDMASFFNPDSIDTEFPEPEARLRRDYESLLSALHALKVTGRVDRAMLARGEQILDMMHDRARSDVEEFRSMMDPDGELAKRLGREPVTRSSYEHFSTSKNSVDAIETLQQGLEAISQSLSQERPPRTRG